MFSSEEYKLMFKIVEEVLNSIFKSRIYIIFHSSALCSLYNLEDLMIVDASHFFFYFNDIKAEL